MIGLIVVPAGALALIRVGATEHLREIDPPPTPVIQTVVGELDYQAQAAAISIGWSEPTEVVAPSGWSGTITAVAVAPGDSVSDGDRVVSIDGADKIAVMTDEPLYRRLDSRSIGADVLDLERALTRLGYLADDPDENFDADTAEAIDALAEDLSVVDDPRGVFDPSWFLWLPSDGFRVAAVQIGIGEPAPAAGDPVVTGPSVVVSAQVAAADGGPLQTDGARILKIDSVEIPFTNGELATGAIDTLDSLLPPTTEAVAGTLVLAAPRTVYPVPSNAVVTSTDGWPCVVVSQTSGMVAMRTSVEPGPVSVSLLTEGVMDGVALVVNPSELEEMPECK